MSDAIQVKMVGKAAIITMNRPDSLNAMNEELVDGLIEALENIAADENLRVAIITGAGRAFCAGGDLETLEKLATDEARKQFIAKVGKIVQLIHDMSKPVVAMVNGVAAGAGFNLALSCDLCYASEEAKFVQSFVNVGLSPDCGGFYYLSKVVGISKAKELMFMAHPILADEAKALGLVNDVFPLSELQRKVLSASGEIAKAAPLAISMTKKGINDYGSTLEDTLKFEVEASSFLLASEDCKEGVDAFREKRVPEFKGK